MSSHSQLKWRCRRGMLELDLLFDRFLASEFNHLTEQEKVCFGRLLDCQDDILYRWFYQGVTPDDQALATLVARIRDGFAH